MPGSKRQDPWPRSYPQVIVTIGDHLRKRRLDLGLLEREVAERLGADQLLRHELGAQPHEAGALVQYDKIGLEHETPMSSAARAALWAAREDQSAIGDRWILPAPKSPEVPVSRFLVDAWWDRAERLAKLPRELGRGWHSCRRTFATELKAAALKDLCALGGWKDRKRY